jgi:hypothetical protein
LAKIAYKHAFTIKNITSAFRKCGNVLFDETHSRRYVGLIDDGKKLFVKKSTLCWLLTKRKERISADRLRRFISATKTTSRNSESDCSIKGDVYTGDWCVFQHERRIIIGQVIGFQYKTEKRKSILEMSVQ